MINNVVESHCCVNDIKWGYLWSKHSSTIKQIRMFWWRPTWPKRPDLIFIVLRCLLYKWFHLISFTQQWASTTLSAILLLAVCSDVPSLSLWFSPSPIPSVLRLPSVSPSGGSALSQSHIPIQWDPAGYAGRAVLQNWDWPSIWDANAYLYYQPHPVK